MFLARQPKERIIQRVGQQLRINRSKIKDASDTNTDFDDIDGAIRSLSLIHILPKWSLAGEGVHICTTDAGSFFASLSDEHHIWIGGPQIEKTENSSTAAAGRR